MFSWEGIEKVGKPGGFVVVLLQIHVGSVVLAFVGEGFLCPEFEDESVSCDRQGCAILGLIEAQSKLLLEF